MRVLFVTNLYPPFVFGGYELACAHTAEAMAERGHQVRVLTTWCHLPQKSKDPDWVHRDLDLHWFVPQSDIHSAFCSSYANTLQLLNTIRDFRPDVVSVWNVIGIGALAMLDLLNKIGVPWSLFLGDRVPVEIAENLSSNVLGLFGGQGSGLYKRARILSVSQHLLDEIESVSGITFPQGSDIVAGWADLSHAVPHEPYLRNGRARFVAASSVVPHKGIDLIVEASARLRDSGLDFSVDVIGDGELRRYMDMARTLQLQDHVRFLGRRSYPDLLRAYAGYDAFLCPTWERDPFPYAPLGAAGCGTPPIITRNCGTSERFVDGVHCIKIDRTAEQLADAMTSVATGRVRLARMARAGQRLMKSDLSFNRYLDRTENALREHARPWQHQAAHDPTLPLLAFLKHNLSLRLRQG
jgi:glycosyltransferase involved in cell wall biosynthesis